MFDNTDVLQLDLNTIGQFYSRKEVWLVYLQMPWMETVVRSREEYILTAQKLFGIVKVATIDC